MPSIFVINVDFYSFVKVIEWLPTMHKDTIKPHVTDKANVSEVKSSSPAKVHGNLKRVLSHVSLMAHLQVLRPQPTPVENLPPPPPLSLSPYQLVSAKSPSLAAAAAASGGGLASDEINLGLPLHGTAKENFKPVLEFLMNCYAVDMVSIVFFMGLNIYILFIFVISSSTRSISQ